MSELSIVNIVFSGKCVHNASYTTKVIWLHSWSDFVPQDKHKNFEINIFYKLQTGNPQNKTNMKYENIDYLIV